MHYNVLFLLLFPINLYAQYYTPMFPFPYIPPTVVKVAPKEDTYKDRGIYRSRYDNEYTALPEVHNPDYIVIDCPPIDPYENTEIIIMEYD